jgi:hypothetical protein
VCSSDLTVVAGETKGKKTGWEALDKWVGGGGGGEATTQERAADLKDDLAKIREDLPEVKEADSSSGKGFFAALKRFFGGK